MIGQLMWSPEKGRGRAETVRLGSLEALRWTVHARPGLAAWRLDWRLRKAERALVRAGVGRVILGVGFPYGGRLTWLRPVDPIPMLRACADVLALGALAAEGVDGRRGRVALSAPRLCPELEGTAERLCPRVRGLVIDVPGGADYARYLQAKFGLPVSPPAAGADVTAAFAPGGGRWGRSVELYEGGCLGGLALAAAGVELPGDCGEQVLAILWEQGRVKRGQMCCRQVDKERIREYNDS